MRKPIEEIRCDRCGRRVTEDKLTQWPLAFTESATGEKWYRCGGILHEYEETGSRCTAVLRKADRAVAKPGQESDEALDDLS